MLSMDRDNAMIRSLQRFTANKEHDHRHYGRGDIAKTTVGKPDAGEDFSAATSGVEAGEAEGWATGGVVVGAMPGLGLSPFCAFINAS